MSPIDVASGHRTKLAFLLRPLAMASLWLALVALASVGFFAPRGTEAQPTIDDVVGFACSMAISGAAAAIVAFGIGGRWRWSVELAVTVVVLCSLAAVLLGYFLWIDPSFVRWRMNRWSFERLQGGSRHWALQLAGFHGPLSAIAGLALGTVAGLLSRLARRRPHLATATALIMLFAFALGTGREYGFDVVTWMGWRLRYLLVPWSISDDQISITGMILGAIGGAVVASLAMHATRTQKA